jgi:small ligand-binding sensory domain FIST
MIRAGAAVSEHRDGVRAAREATQRAMANAGIERADAVFLFATPEHTPRFETMLGAVSAAAGTRAISGCSGQGVICGAREVERGPAVSALVAEGPGLVFETGLLPEGPPARDVGAAVGHLVKKGQLAPETPAGAAIVLFPALKGFDPGAFLEGLEATGGFVPVVGGAPSGRGARASVFAGLDALEGRTGTAILRGGARLEVAVAQGCRPIGRPVVITRTASATEILTLASRPAAELLAEAMESAGVDDSGAATQAVFAGIAIDPKKHPLERGDFLVRPIVEIDPKTGAIGLGDRVAVGRTLVFQLRDREAAERDMEETLAALHARLAGRAPRFALYFDCLGRGSGLFGVPDHDATAIRRRFPDLPLAGFFGNGEVAPAGGKNHLHAYTGVLAVFCEP